MAGAKIALSSTTGELRTDGFDNARVNLPLDETTAGHVSVVSEVDSGDVLGSRTVRQMEITAAYRARVGVDQVAFSHSFEGTVIARDRIQQNDTTATSAQASGFLTINSGGSTTSGQGSNIRTYRTFPLFGAYSTFGDFWVRSVNNTATNAVSEWGFGYVSGVVATPTDGVYFRVISGGTLRAVVNFGGSETVVTDITTTNIPGRDGTGAFDIGEVNHYIIDIDNDVVQFWINDTLVAKSKTPSNQGAPSSSMALPMFARVYNSGTASAARSLGIGFLGATYADGSAGRAWGHAMCGMGGGAYQIQPGTTSGPTVTRGAGTLGWPTSATARAAGTWTATSAPALNSLGGLWLSPAISTLTSDADYPVFAYLNPAGTATLPGKTLVITGIRVGETVATVAASTNAITLLYAAGIGSTGSGTAVTEAAAAVAARIIPLGSAAFAATAAIGTMCAGFEVDFSYAPLICPPGTYVHFIVRPYGTVTSNTLVASGSVTFKGYHE